MHTPGPLLVSATGSWQQPRLERVTADSRATWNARATLARAVSVRSAATLERLWQAVRRAACDRVGSALILPPEEQTLGTLLTVRPARERGFAIVTRADVGAAPPPPPVEIVASLLGITPSEAEIAVQLLRGVSVADIASARQTSVDTVRGHVKSVLRKTGMPSQRHLTALLSRVAVMHFRATQASDS